MQSNGLWQTCLQIWTLRSYCLAYIPGDAWYFAHRDQPACCAWIAVVETPEDAKVLLMPAKALKAAQVDHKSPAAKIAAVLTTRSLLDLKRPATTRT